MVASLEIERISRIEVSLQVINHFVICLRNINHHYYYFVNLILRSLKLYHLSDGQRVLTETNLIDFFKDRKNQKLSQNESTLNLDKFVGFTVPKAALPKNYLTTLNPVTFTDSQNRTQRGFSVELIPIICRIYSDDIY